MSYISYKHRLSRDYSPVSHSLIYNDQQHRERYLNEYKKWIEGLLRWGRDDDDCWYACLVTLMFHHIQGDFRRRKLIMFDEVERVYSTLICHIIRDARSPSQRTKLPIGIFALDLPVWKKIAKLSPQAMLRGTAVNEGLHVNGVMVIPTETRLRIHLKDHLDPQRDPYRRYVRDDRPLRRIDVEPIRKNPAEVVDYAFKTIKFKLPDLDNLLLLPRSRSELPTRSSKPLLSRTL